MMGAAACAKDAIAKKLSGDPPSFIHLANQTSSSLRVTKKW